MSMPCVPVTTLEGPETILEEGELDDFAAGLWGDLIAWPKAAYGPTNLLRLNQNSRSAT